jgi:hypothetical protein
MNWLHWLVWGFSGTVVLTSILAASQGFGLTRMNIPYLLGTMFTPNRDKAKVIGFFIHFANGWLFALVYVAGFHAFGVATWWFGAVIGLTGDLCSYDGATDSASITPAHGERTIRPDDRASA